MSSPLAALYNAADIILWVEDLTTSVYLDTLWQHDWRIKLYVGGGHETLAAVVKDGRSSNGRRSLYSLRDRDFGPTNQERWSEEDTWQFVLKTFEVECFLLDPLALAACPLNTSKKSEAWIAEHLASQARELLWWMSCRAVLAELREARQERFPSHPTRTAVTSRGEAEAVLLDNDWVRRTAPGLKDVVTPKRLRDALTAAHERYDAHIQAGDWVTYFSGKELLAGLIGHVYTKGRPAGDAAYQDLAKAVADTQRRLGRVPAELNELFDVMMDRLSQEK